LSGLEGDRLAWRVMPGSMCTGGLGWVLWAMVAEHVGMSWVHRKPSGQINVLPRMWGKD